MSRPLHTIADEIVANWPKVATDLDKGPGPFGYSVPAAPYVESMLTLESVNSRDGYEDGRSIVRYFLANAGSWRGEVARSVKAELKSML